MAPSQPNATSSPHPAGPSTISSSSTSPTGTHSTVATTVGNGANTGNRQRSWDEDKHLNLYILDYCRHRKFDEAASAFAREANLSPDSKVSFDAPQGLLFEWWIVFWETFNSQRSNISGPSGQRESGQAYVNTMTRLRKLAMHEKDEQNRTRSMSMSMSTPGMHPMMPGMPPVMNGSGSASAMSTPAMSNMPNPMGQRPQSQASLRMVPQPLGMGHPGQQPMGPAGQPGMPQQQGPGVGPGQMNGPGPQQPGMGGPPQPGMGQGPQRPQQPGMGMPPTGMNMTHAPTPHPSTPSAPHLSSSPSPIATPPQSFAPGGPGPQQAPFNPQFNPSQPQFSGPGGPGQPQFTGQPGQFQGGPGNNPQFRPGPGQNGGPPAQNTPFPPNAGPGFQPGGPGNQNFPGQPGFQPGGPQQPFQPGPGNAQFSGGPGPGPGGQFPPGARQGGPGPGLQFANNNQPPDWGQRPPPIGPGGPEPGRRPDGSWEDPRRGGMMAGPPNKMNPAQMRFLSQAGPGGPPPNMMGGQPGMGGPQQMGGPMPSPKEDARSVTPQQTQANWGDGGVNMQRRPGMAAQGGQMGPGRPGFNPQGPNGQGAQKRPGSPPPSAAMNNLGGGSPPEKRARTNDPGPAPLVDSRMGADGRPTSSKGGVSFQGAPGMNGQPGNPQQQRLNGEQQYRQELSGATQEMRVQVLRHGPQPPPFGKGQQQANGANASNRGSRPPDAPSPAAGGEPAGQPRQVMNVKGQGGAMGPPVSPSLVHRNVAVKKSESAGNSPALPPSTLSNGMNPGDRSHTPQQMRQAGSHSPMPAPMTRPQSAQPMMSQQGPPIGIPAPPPSAPPTMQTSQSPSNGLLPFGNTRLDQQFDFGEDVDFANFDEIFPGMVDPMMGLDNWPNGTD